MMWQTITAALALSVVAWFMSHVIFAWQKPTMRAVLVTLLLASVIMTVIGALLFVALYFTQTHAFDVDVNLGLINWAIYFLKLGLLTAFFWMPILLIVALSQARRIPKLS
ncbi:MAG: hypothetical protein ABI459_06795 [Deltaproteobacteria bacterium]